MKKSTVSLPTIAPPKNIYLFLVVVILLIGIFLRFYNADIRYSFGDEAFRDVAVAITGARELQFPLTGPFSSAGPFTFGPWYWYHLIVIKLILPTPYAPWILLGVLSSLTILVYYKIGELLLDKRLGLLIAFFVALSPSHITSSFGLSNPNMMHLYIALAFYLFLLSIKKNTSNAVYLFFGIALGIAANMHYQALALFTLPVLGIIFKKHHRFTFFLYSALGIFITFLPLLFFNAINHWHTLRNFVDYSILNKKNIEIPYRWLFYIRDFWPSLITEVFGTPPLLSIVLLIFTMLSALYLTVKKKIPSLYIILIIAFIVDFFYLRYYSREKYFGYLHFLHPFLFIFIPSALFIAVKRFKYTNSIILVFAIVFAIYAIPYNIAKATPDVFNLDAKKRVSEIQQQYPGNYALYKCKEDNNGIYQTYVFSTLFLLEEKDLMKDPKTKLAFISLKCNIDEKEMRLINIPKEKLEGLQPGNYINVSYASDDTLRKMGFEKVNFEQKYDESVRWWYDEKP